MKAIIAISLIACTAGAQNVAIRTLANAPEHEFHAVPGCPPGWPVIVDNLGTNTASPHAGRTVVTARQLAEVYETIGPAFTNWHRSAWAHHARTNMLAVVQHERDEDAERASIIADLRRQTNFTPAVIQQAVSNIVRLQLLNSDGARGGAVGLRRQN